MSTKMINTDTQSILKFQKPLSLSALSYPRPHIRKREDKYHSFLLVVAISNRTQNFYWVSKYRNNGRRDTRTKQRHPLSRLVSLTRRWSFKRLVWGAIGVSSFLILAPNIDTSPHTLTQTLRTPNKEIPCAWLTWKHVCKRRAIKSRI
jgi:hypothetical protein